MKRAAALLALSTAAIVGAAMPADAEPGAAGSGAAARRRAPAGGAVAENARCAGCHEEEAREWAGDQHRSAFDDPVFQRAFAREPLPYCQSCHAPEARGAAPGAATSLGVACTSCHGLASAVVGATIPTPAHPALQPVDPSPPGACAGCHQFTFPPGASQPSGLMQRTVDEHGASPFATVSCATCHMPEQTRGGRARRGHRFLGGHDADFVRTAVAVRTARSGGVVQIVLEAGRVGHSFPTGDLFRRISIVAEAMGPEESVVTERTLVLARHFERRVDRGGNVQKVEVRDDRLQSGERRVIALDLGPDAARLPVRFSVTYERLDVPAETVVTRDGRVVPGPPAQVEGSVVIAQGTLRPTPPR